MNNFEVKILTSVMNGMSMLGEVDGDIFKNPTIFTTDDNNRVVFMPLLPFSKEESIKISELGAVIMTTPIDKMKDAFVSHHSKIIMPDSNILS